ncbi:hypothetical protein I204_03647 [Kwoniella mangroviensis CBS 8886]|uniref:uncharacterized protein n=1 Tax=Kwoniella mangroviensis CBS 8507 TaxID=1296122 RepID=UPI00080CC5ED|nr:uncharacterized protein I203_00703 [Kwoniella mangroviensis CBS 8507]OCF70568.1 hypothetical protein I203_00703 [Kwoniella mangroviensis CBS 8507]OCF76347.1 hypothetical protein I204_03647 [Kwoniella mangroviensis CBS 8886]
MEAFDTWDSRLHKVQAEYMTYALPKYDFRSTFESTLTDCIQSTRSTKTKLDSYNWVAQSGILIPTNQMEEVKSSVFETEDKYRKFEEVNGGKLFEEVMTPTSPWTLERTENLDKKWKEWLTLTGDALAIGEAKNYFLRQSMMMNGQMF